MPARILQCLFRLITVAINISGVVASYHEALRYRIVPCFLSADTWFCGNLVGSGNERVMVEY